MRSIWNGIFVILALSSVSPMATAAEEESDPKLSMEQAAQINKKIDELSLKISFEQLERISKETIPRLPLSPSERDLVERKIAMAKYHMSRAAAVADEKIRDWEAKSCYQWLESVIKQIDKLQ